MVTFRSGLRHCCLVSDARTFAVRHAREEQNDSAWFRSSENFITRAVTRDYAAPLIQRGLPIELVFPILSRKPFSPLKNRGNQPDLAEIYTVARLGEAAMALNQLSPTGCCIRILADGHKYRRACKTPKNIVDQYQNDLLYWIDAVEITGIVDLVDYEIWIENSLSDVEQFEREVSYQQKVMDVRTRYGSFFDVDSIGISHEVIKAADDVGRQLCFTFYSMLTSTHYDTLFNGFAGAAVDIYDNDDIQALYIEHIARLALPAVAVSARRDYSATFGYLTPNALGELFHTMRLEVWQAACRYVAISLVDRERGLLRHRAPNAFKLTIHGKPNEFQFITSPLRDVGMTAQHATGGIAFRDGKTWINYRYRIERETDSETPLTVSIDAAMRHTPERYGPLARLARSGQPFAYTNDPQAFVSRDIFDLLGARI